MELSKNDWKLFRERLPGWQERYMDKLTREYAEFLTDDRCQPSERFWTLNKRIREDRRKRECSLNSENRTLCLIWCT